MQNSQVEVLSFSGAKQDAAAIHKSINTEIDVFEQEDWELRRVSTQIAPAVIGRENAFYVFLHFVKAA